MHSYSTLNDAEQDEQRYVASRRVAYKHLQPHETIFFLLNHRFFFIFEYFNLRFKS